MFPRLARRRPCERSSARRGRAARITESHRPTCQWRLIERVSGAAEDVLDFVADEFFDLGASGGEVFAGVEFFRVFGHDLADGGGQGEAEVGIDIDLGDAGAAGDFDIGFGDAGGVFAQFTAVVVDFGDEVFGDAGGAVEDEWVIAEAGIEEGFFDGLEAFEVEVLFSFEFVGAVGVADSDGDGVDAGLADELDGFFGVSVDASLRVMAAFFAFVELGADELAEFTFDDAIVFVGVVDDFLAELDVFVEGMVAAVDHDAGEAFVDAFLAEFVGIAVVEVDGDGDIGEADGGFDEFFEVDGVGILAGAFGDLEHDGRFFLFAGFDDGLEQFHIVHVEGSQGVFALEGLCKQVARVGQWHNFDLRILGLPATGVCGHDPGVPGGLVARGAVN